jgi:hypothetical protein
MSPQVSWQTIKDELSQLSADQKYQSYKPLLDTLQHMADAKYPSPEIVKGVLDGVLYMQAQGTSTQEIVKKVEGGYVQPDWIVEGDVNQANRDLIKNTFVTIVNNNSKDLKKNEEDASILVPIVLLVMTKAEAEGLLNLQAFEGFTEQIYTEQFNRYQRALEEKSFINWIQHYGEKPEEWQPFINDPATISEVVTQALGSIEGYEHPLIPNFIDVRTLNEDTLRRSLWNLRQNGCVVIIDSISIRHPVIQRAYRRTLLDAFPNTLLVKLNPFSDPSELEEQMIKFSERYLDLEFFKRFRVDLDGKCDEVEDNFHFKRWLKDQAPKLLPENEKAKKGWRKHAFK